MDLEVVIEGVSDLRVVNAIKRQARQVCRDNKRRGQWTLTVFPSETRGEWDLGVRGPFGRHFASFTDHVDQLPELVADQLHACLTIDGDERVPFSDVGRPPPDTSVYDTTKRPPK